jgi:protein-disulfide isomerase
MSSPWRRISAFISLLLLPSVAAFAGSAGQGKRFGEERAPLRIEVFSDFQCTACAAYHLSTVRSLLNEDVARGRVHVVFHIITPGRGAYRSYSAARFANAAACIGKFREVSEALFSKQKIWSETGDVEGVVAGVLTKEEMTRVREVMRTEDLDQAIAADMALARIHGIHSTPTTIIRHQGQATPVVGAVSYSILKRYLDRLLEGAR